MKTHTPGPWIADLALDGAFDIKAEVWEYGCLVITARPRNCDRAEEMHANAHLIAAAPALLAMVERYASECGECGGTGSSPIGATVIGGEIEEVSMDCAGCIDIRALLKSARGNQS